MVQQAAGSTGTVNDIAELRARRDALSADAERRLLKEMFRNAPVPLLLLERNGVIRRANLRASQLLGAAPGLLGGRLLTTFVDPPARAAAAAQLASAARTGRHRHLRCQLLGGDEPYPALLTIAPLRTDGEPLLVVTADRDVLRGAADRRPASARPAVTGEPAAARDLDEDSARLVAAMSQRLDLVTAATRLLLDNATFSESTTLRRCARLLASELAAWAIVDVERRQRLHRQVVIGPADRELAGQARRVAAVHPGRGTLPRRVHESGRAVLAARDTEPDLLGASRDGAPLLAVMDAASVLCVPLSDGERTYGTLTLARRAGERPFEATDLELVEELGQQLGLAIRVDRMFRRRSEIADSLQASLLPSELPVLPGVTLAAAYVAATDADGVEVGGDFYDVYRSPGGWGIAIGDVCGKGEEAAAVTAAARHAIRTLAHWNPDPADVLRRAGEMLLSPDDEGRFVTACAGHLRWDAGRLHVTMASAGHPAPFLIRADGAVAPLRGGGMPLGLFADAEPGAEEIVLAEGDLLVLFTDGVTEARNPDIEYFEDQLAAALAGFAGATPAEVVAGLQAQVLEFSQNELRDDMTMLVVAAGVCPDSTV
jgi:serine phosphatase RsbU (regulator of sigma subunit)